MKRYLFILTFSVLSLAMMAAELPKQGFGFQIGYAQPTLRLNSPNVLYPKDSLVNTTQLHGLKAGLVYDGSFIKGFGASLGINYTFATTNTVWESGVTVYPKVRNQLFYHQMEVFVDWQYKFEIAKETYLMLYTGPTIQYGIAFKEKTQTDMFGTISITGEASRYDEDLTNTNLRQLNATWGVGAGFQYKRYFLRGGYDFGLINPYKNAQFAVAGTTIDRYTRGRLDQWEIKLGMYLWYK
ncbi:MAG: outer membrane beta-barrel protein [Paludibacteraceae bacterium]|nr:outer membrane beta-barrel protein [Paludibacteraceae bacterium]